MASSVNDPSAPLPAPDFPPDEWDELGETDLDDGDPFEPMEELRPGVDRLREVQRDDGPSNADILEWDRSRGGNRKRVSKALRADYAREHGLPVDEPGPEDTSGPRHATREFRRERQEKARKAGPRLTDDALRKDIAAKVGFPLMIAGQMWQSRDPFCGSVFNDSRDGIAEAATDLIMDSPDLIAWFTGPASGFMKYFRLAMALQPVVSAVFAHHVAHTVREEYAAPADLSGLAA